jgi:hypothetical protein
VLSPGGFAELRSTLFISLSLLVSSFLCPVRCGADTDNESMS